MTAIDRDGVCLVYDNQTKLYSLYDRTTKKTIIQGKKQYDMYEILLKDVSAFLHYSLPLSDKTYGALPDEFAGWKKCVIRFALRSRDCESESTPHHEEKGELIQEQQTVCFFCHPRNKFQYEWVESTLMDKALVYINYLEDGSVHSEGLRFEGKRKAASFLFDHMNQNQIRGLL